MGSLFMLKKVLKAVSEGPQLFRRCSNPKLIMTLLVKDEADMLEENLLFHHSMGVDGFIVTDNNSTDRTPEIIRKYKEKGWILEALSETGTNYAQKKWVDRMIWLAKTRYKADWIINSDADEMWYAPSGNLKDELITTKANVLVCELQNVYPEEGKPFWQWSHTVKAVKNPDAYQLSPYSIFTPNRHKVIHRAAGYLQISMGNHKVMMLPRRKVKSSIYIYHYCVRGKQAFLKKMINGGQQLEQGQQKHGGRHWRYFYQLYKEGQLEQEYDRVIGSASFEQLRNEGFIYEDKTIPDYFKQLMK